MLELTHEQKQFIEAALDGNNILVNACIGSGKTTAIQQLCNQLPSTKSALYLTYNRLLKLDAQSKIHEKNVTVNNYHGFASRVLKSNNIQCGVTDLIQTLLQEKPELPKFDMLIIDEYQDIDLELSQMLEMIKASNEHIQIIAVGDMEQKIYDKTALNVSAFIDSFLGSHVKLEFTRCFRLNSEYAKQLGFIWKKEIIGVNDDCVVEEMDLNQVVDYLSTQDPGDILCLGSRNNDMVKTLNELEKRFPEKFNKKTVYASIRDQDGNAPINPKSNSAIFTTYDSSKGLERKICVLFDFTEEYWSFRINQPEQSYEILRNVFCVAASRGKEHIIWVKSNETLLKVDTLATPVQSNKKFGTVDISSMFDFKYKESVEKCYKLLSISDVSVDDIKEIAIKSNDGLIDLSPCIGTFQEASFFDGYDIDKEIDLFKEINPDNAYLTNSYDRNASLEEKNLYRTYIETRQQRYLSQVTIPYISEKKPKMRSTTDC